MLDRNDGFTMYRLSDGTLLLRVTNDNVTWRTYFISNK